MPSALDLLSMILATAKIRGFDREQTAALQEVHDAMTCERCVLVRRGDGRGSLAGMADPIAPLESSLSVVRSVAADLEALVARPPEDPREMLARIKACAASLRAIGGPIDPNAPSGG